LILHPRTGLISPQFHCVFEDNFETLSNLGRFALLWPPNSKLQTKAFASSDYFNTFVPRRIAPPWFLCNDDDESIAASDDSSIAKGNLHDVDYNLPDERDDPPDAPIEPDPHEQANPQPGDLHSHDATCENEGANEGAPNDENEGAHMERNEGARAGTNKGASTGTHREQGAPSTFQTRSGRTVKVSEKVLESDSHFGSIDPEFSTKLALSHFCACMPSLLDDFTFNEFHPLAYVASLANKDTMNFAEVMKQDDRDKFVDAMEKEVSDHVTRNHWKIYSCAQMRKMGYTGRVIMAVWSFKRKQNPFGVVTKYKARLCAHGGQTRKGVH
jgi:hypothetical protein